MDSPPARAMASKLVRVALSNCLPLRGRWRVWNHVVCILLGLGFLYLLVTSLQWSSISAPASEIDLKLINWSRISYLPRTRCRFHRCFNISRCVFSTEDRIGVHVGGWYEFHAPQTSSVLSPKVSLEYAELLEAVKGSHYYASDPANACIFIPPLDTLGQGEVKASTMSMLLNSLPQ